MPEPFKNFLGPAAVIEIARHLRATGGLDADAFEAQALDGLEPLELKARSLHIAAALAAHLPAFPDALAVLRATLHPDSEATLAEMTTDTQGLRGWALMPVGDYVAEAGLSHPEAALDFLREMTSRFTSEFAVRPYLRDHTQLALTHVRAWAADENAHVRRLASEGTRPRLPWGLRLSGFVQDPAPLLPILEGLRDDPSDYVRRSVANNLNDIAKDNPSLVTDLTARWLADAPPDRQKLIKHALRSLIKAGDPAALALMGYAMPTGLTVQLFVAPAQITLGETLTITAELAQPGPAPLPILADLILRFRKANGSLAPKVFKWTETTLASGRPLTLSKALPLRDVTTRKHYAGRQEIALQVNGHVLAEATFELTVPA